METKIKVKGKQVKGADQVEGRGRGRSMAPEAHAAAGRQRAEGQPKVVKENGRAKAFREMARRLRFEALLLDVAAATEEEEPSVVLASWAKVKRKWRHEAKERKLAAEKERAGSVTLQ